MHYDQQRLFPDFDIASGKFKPLDAYITCYSVLANLAKEKSRALISLSYLYQEALNMFIPDTVNNLLYAMTYSEDLYKIYLAPLRYFFNICVLQSWFSYKPKVATDKNVNVAYTKQLACLMSIVSSDKLFQFLDYEHKQKVKEPAYSLAMLYSAIARRENVTITFSYLDCIKSVNAPYIFTNKLLFKYATSRLYEDLHIVVYDLPQNYRQYYEGFISQQASFHQLNEDVSSQNKCEVSTIISIADSIFYYAHVASGTFYPLLKLLALRVLGQDFVRIDEEVYCMVTPQQLTILLADTSKKEVKFTIPQSYVVININGQPYFYLYYKIPAQYETVSMLSQYHTKLMSSFLKYLDSVSKEYYASIPHRTLFFHSLSTNNIFVQIPKEYNYYCVFMVPAVPTGTIELQDLPSPLQFIHSNLRLDYVFYFVLIYVISAGLLLCEPLASHIQHVITLGQVLGEDATLYKYMLELTNKVVTLIRMVTRSAQTPQLLYFCVTKNNMMNEQILAIITILKCGFLSLRHSTMYKILSFELNHYEFVRYDRQTVWYTFLQHMQMYTKADSAARAGITSAAPQQSETRNTQTADNDLLDSARCLLSMSVNNMSGAGMSMRAYLCQKIPLLEAFLEFDELPFFGNTERPVKFIGQSSTAELSSPLAPEFAKNRLIALLHELQHIPRHSYLSDLDLQIPLLPQILADATSITPLSAAIRFHYKDQAGVDAGGMWRATLTLLFDDLLAEKPITNEVLYRVKEANKFGNRDLQFEVLNQDNPNPPSLLKAINLNNKSILVPHYNGYNCQTSSSIFPRLTDKRSCLYYLGRVFSFCLVYSGRVPDFLHYNFWKSLVGGRLYFDDKLIDYYRREYEGDPMFKINGTKRFSELLYPLTLDYIQIYYKQYYDIWQTALRGEITDIDMLGIHPKIVEELMRQQVNLAVEGNVQRYAKLALKQLGTGQSLGKAYSEFRNGFRHPFATSMVNPVGVELQYLARQIDICFDAISWRDLHDLMTFDSNEEELIGRSEIVSNLLERNIAQIELEHEYTKEKIAILNRIKALINDSANYSHKEMLDFVFAVTGQRSLRGTEIIINFIKPTKETKTAEGLYQRKFILFHTCFNQIDIPIGYAMQLDDYQFAQYFKECIYCALQNGFAMT